TPKNSGSQACYEKQAQVSSAPRGVTTEHLYVRTRLGRWPLPSPPTAAALFSHRARRGNVVAREPSCHDDIVSGLATRKGEGKSVQRARKTTLGLMAILAVVSSLTLLRCSEEIQQTAISDVRNHSFTFSNGVVFHPALENIPTTLSFLDNPASFTLS